MFYVEKSLRIRNRRIRRSWQPVSLCVIFTITRAGLKGGPAGQLPGAPNHNGCKNVTGIIGSLVLTKQISTRERIYPKILRSLHTRCQKGSPALSWVETF